VNGKGGEVVMITLRRLRDDKGTALFTVVSFVLIMTLMGMGASMLVPFETRAVNERLESERALFMAEAGLEYAKGYLEGKFPSLPGQYSETMYLPGGSFSIQIEPQAMSSPWTQEYLVTSMGTVGNTTRVLQSSEKAGAFSKYVYFTDLEQPPSLDMPIWFATSDSISGPLHTNDQIHIMGDPMFTAEVTSAYGGPDDNDPSHSPSFMYYNGSYTNHVESAEPSNPPYDVPAFDSGYQLGVGQIDLPDNISDLQYIAQEAGLYLTQSCEIKFARSVAGNPLHGYLSFRYRIGGAWGDWNDIEIGSLENPVVYVDGNTRISGKVDGQLTLAASGNIQIKSDVVYRGSTGGIPDQDCDDMLGLVAGNNVVVLNNDPNRDDCAINGSILALDGCFYVNDYDSGNPRGILRVIGGIIQKYRGPVGTGWVDGEGEVHILTGYMKDYRFDERFREDSPPYFFSTGQYERLAWNEVPCEDYE
jgi:hypothetical protein